MLLGKKKDHKSALHKKMAEINGKTKIKTKLLPPFHFTIVTVQKKKEKKIAK